MSYRDTRRALEALERDISGFNYLGVFDQPETKSYRIIKNGITPNQVTAILSQEAVSAPYGYELLFPMPLPIFSKIPPCPLEALDQYDKKKADELEHRLFELKQDVTKKIEADTESATNIKKLCIQNDSKAVAELMSLTLIRHPLPKVLWGASHINIDIESRVILATIEIPDFKKISIVRRRGNSLDAEWPVSVTERKRLLEIILYSLILRCGYLLANSDAGDWFDTIAINAKQKWDDPATGVQREGIIASLQSTKNELKSLQIDKVEPKVCFRHLKGISTPSFDQISPVRPIFVVNTNDERIVENRDVASGIDDEENLAAMPWEDFEHLVRQLFEWEFGVNGIEVKVTRASRDRGVDAIMFDPDPLRGGKYILQAKRYTRTVDVAAVRDLYGTIVNEGANRGILVTTSRYGPDAYEFAKNKPITLVDGPNLIAMLRRHGCNCRIDLEEARRLNIE